MRTPGLALATPRHAGRVALRCRPLAYKTSGRPLPLAAKIYTDQIYTLHLSVASSHRIHRQSPERDRVHSTHRPFPFSSALPPCPVVALPSARRERQLAAVEAPSPVSRRHEEGRGEAGRARRQAQGQGAQGRLRSPWHRSAGRGHEGPEDDHRGHRRPRRRRRQAAQALPGRADRLRRSGQGGEEGRQEGRRRGQEGRRRQEGGRQERRGQEGRRRQEAAGREAGRAGVPALLVPDAAAAALRRPQRRGGPQLVRHLLMDTRRRRRPAPCTFRRCPALPVFLCCRRLVVAVLISPPAAAIAGGRYTYVYDRVITSCTASIGVVWLIFGKMSTAGMLYTCIC